MDKLHYLWNTKSKIRNQNKNSFIRDIRVIRVLYYEKIDWYAIQKPSQMGCFSSRGNRYSEGVEGEDNT